MKKTTCLFAFAFLLFSCRHPAGKWRQLETNTDSLKTREAMLKARVDSLEKKLNRLYQPGLGEFMSAIQVHHAKLWFSGKAGNWKLAEFEISEIMETVEAVQKSGNDKKQSDLLPMLVPAIDSLNLAISRKDLKKFNSGFSLLTNTCNACHQATGYPVNVIKTPDSPPFSNQVFQNE